MKEKRRKYKLKKFKFPIDLIEFPIKYSTVLKVLKGKEKLLEFYLEGRYGPYYIDAPRKYKLMDIRTLLATLYFTDYYKDISFEEKFTNWLNLLEVSDTGFYIISILKGLNFLKTTTFYTPCIYDTQKQQRYFTLWVILDSYYHLREEKNEN
ncbi:hypothetical protein ES702_01289 [subsurface metagenome]